jgi:hypothetical protein
VPLQQRLERRSEMPISLPFACWSSSLTFRMVNQIDGASLSPGRRTPVQRDDDS